MAAAISAAPAGLADDRPKKEAYRPRQSLDDGPRCHDGLDGVAPAVEPFLAGVWLPSAVCRSFSICLPWLWAGLATQCRLIAGHDSTPARCLMRQRAHLTGPERKDLGSNDRKKKWSGYFADLDIAAPVFLGQLLRAPFTATARDGCRPDRRCSSWRLRGRFTGIRLFGTALGSVVSTEAF